MDIRDFRQLLSHIEALEQEAHRIGAHITARALNCAKNSLGWEQAGNPLAAGKAARGVRPKSALSRT